jgi:hypothetical protein
LYSSVRPYFPYLFDARNLLALLNLDGGTFSGINRKKCDTNFWTDLAQKLWHMLALYNDIKEG